MTENRPRDGVTFQVTQVRKRQSRDLRPAHLSPEQGFNHALLSKKQQQQWARGLFSTLRHMPVPKMLRKICHVMFKWYSYLRLITNWKTEWTGDKTFPSLHTSPQAQAESTSLSHPQQESPWIKSGRRQDWVRELRFLCAARRHCPTGGAASFLLKPTEEF